MRTQLIKADFIGQNNEIVDSRYKSFPLTATLESLLRWGRTNKPPTAHKIEIAFSYMPRGLHTIRS